MPELLKNAHAQTDELHSVVTSALLKFRMEMSTVLTGTVKESLLHILKALESVQPKTAGLLTSVEVDSDAEQIGYRIGRCSAEADRDIQAAVKQFFAVFTPIQRESLTVLNTVLELIVQWNIASDPSDMAASVHSALEVKNNALVSNALPLLEDELRKFKNTLLLIPSTVSRCVDQVLTN